MKVRVDSINSEMILSQDVYTKDAKLLIPKNTQLTKAIILKLLEFGIYQVQVKDTWSSNAEYKDFEKNYAEAVEKIKNTFETAKYKQTVDISEFESIIDDLLTRTNSGGSVLSYMKLIEQKDEYTLQHSINVSIAAMLMGKWLNYSEKDIKLLGIGAILHDIGKILIPDNILNKPAKLTDIEFNIMRNHTKLGYKLLKESGINNETIRNVALTHHERFNGEGYPYGLKGYGISEHARITAICDVFDAVTSKRVYKPKENPLKGLKAIFEDSYNGLDPYLCKVFMNNVITAYSGSNVILNNGTVGKIIRIIPENPTKPWISVGNGFYDLEKSKGVEIIDVI